MDLSFSKDQEIFRTEVRDFLSKNLDSDMSSKMKLGIMLSKEEIEAWHSKLNEKFPRTPAPPLHTVFWRSFLGFLANLQKKQDVFFLFFALGLALVHY